MSAARMIVLFLVTIAGVAWGATAGADLAEIEKRGTLRVVVSIDELPHMFSFEEGGDPGLEREMVEAFARSRGLTGAQRVLQDLRDGTVDAVVMSVTDFAQAQREDGMLQAGLLVGSTASAGWGLRKEDTALRRALDEFLRSLLSSGSWNRMVLKYFSKDALDLIARGRR